MRTYVTSRSRCDIQCRRAASWYCVLEMRSPLQYCYHYCIEVGHLSQLLRRRLPTALYLIGSLFTLVSVQTLRRPYFQHGTVQALVRYCEGALFTGEHYFGTLQLNYTSVGLCWASVAITTHRSTRCWN